MTSPGASRRHPFHPRSMTRPCLPVPLVVSTSSSLRTFLSLSLSLFPLVLTPATHRAEQTGPSTQRGGGCFCNLATPSIFSIDTTSCSRYFAIRLSSSFSLPPSFSLFLPVSRSLLLSFSSIYHSSCKVDDGVLLSHFISLFSFLLPILSLARFSLFSLSATFPSVSLADINNAIAQASNPHADDSNNV